MSIAATFGLVGSGWRAEFFVRLARVLPERVTLVGAAVRRASVAEEVAERWGVPTYLSAGELVRKQRPDFVVSCVSWDSNPQVVVDLVEGGTRVLSETPPAPDGSGLRRLWELVGGREAVQVAEQYLLMPGHAARRVLVSRGVIGAATSVQVSSTHMYHAVSMMRGLLGVGCGPVSVTAARTVAPLVNPLGKGGWTDDDSARETGTTIAVLDFGDGRSGVYDFTENQWHNQLRARRIVVRGGRGEIVDDSVIRLGGGPRTILRSQHVRSQSGYDLNLDGYDTEHISFEGDVVYRNPFLGLRLMDEEIAIATILTATGAWARDEGPAPYPLAEACQDHLVALAVEQAADRGERVSTAVEAWGRGRPPIE